MNSWAHAGVTVLREKLVRIPAGLVGVPLAIKPGRYVSGAAYFISFLMVMAGFLYRPQQHRRPRRCAEPEVVAA